MDSQIALFGHKNFPAWTASATLQVRQPGWRYRTIAWLMVRLGPMSWLAVALCELVRWFENHTFLSV